LIDAPCSNTGVLRRRVDLRWRVSAEEVLRLQKTQTGLLQQVAPCLKPGGILVYSTCSLEPEENTEVIKSFLAAHPAYRLESERHLLPFADQVDGAYVARLKLFN
jgi:16S rRNA (cytosine967-C5)-methyltransferase